MGRRAVMRYSLRVRRRRSKSLGWQAPLLMCVLSACAFATLSPTAQLWGRRLAGFAAAPATAIVRQLSGVTVSLDPYTNNQTEWCSYTNPALGEGGGFDTTCPDPKCAIEVPIDYKDEASPYYPKSPNRSSISYMSNYVVLLDLNSTIEEVLGQFTLASLKRIPLMESEWFKGDTEATNPYYVSYQDYIRNDWFYNKADLVQYAYATKAQREAAGAATLRVSGPGGKAVFGRWFGPVGVKREIYVNSNGVDEVVDVVPGSRHGCQNGEACLEPPLELRICADPVDVAPEDPLCKDWVKHDTSTTRNNIRLCELPNKNYPTDLFTFDAKRKGALAFHVVIICFMFIGIAIVCDEFFEPALGEICDFLSMKDDVAGATFMAAGGSAPELFTSIMGVFIAKNDIGFGTIVGSAVFNVLFVIAVCAFVCPGLQLSYWPLVRDSSYYCFSILMLVFFILDEKVKIYESCTLFVFYLVYVGVMKWNEDMEVFISRKLAESNDLQRLGPMRGLVRKYVDHTFVAGFIYVCILANIICIIVEPSASSKDGGITGFQIANFFFCAVFVLEFVFKIIGHSFVGYWKDPMNAFDGILVLMIGVELALGGAANAGGFRAVRVIRFFKTMRGLRIIRLYRLLKAQQVNASTQWEEGDWNKKFDTMSVNFKHGFVAEEESSPSSESKKSVSTKHRVASPLAPQPGKTAKVVPAATPTRAIPAAESVEHGDTVPKQPEAPPKDQGVENSAAVGEEEEDDDDDDEPFNPLDFGDGKPMDYIVVGLSMPLRVAMFLTIPDCRREQFKKLFPVTFFMCILWIAAYSYIMVWMAVQFGCTTGIPDPVMGLTLLAAGTSIPDALSSLAVAKKGHGDMAVSSSIGSNIFDILFGLAVPWILGTAVTGSCLTPISIRSSSMAIMVLTLFIMVAVMIMCIVFSGWKLTRKLGLVYMTLYILFVIESLLLEYGVIFSG